MAKILIMSSVFFFNYANYLEEFFRYSDFTKWTIEHIKIVLSGVGSGVNLTVDDDVERADGGVAREISECVDDRSGAQIEDVSRNKVALGVEASGVVHGSGHDPGGSYHGNVLVYIQDDIAGAVGDDGSNFIDNNCKRKVRSVTDWSLFALYSILQETIYPDQALFITCT